MPARRLITFTVQGTGSFPMDMLRYDSCFPRESVDAEKMTDYPGERRPARQINLCTWQEGRHWMPSDGRWNSFMWKVVEVRHA